MQSLALLKPIQSILWSVALLLLGNGLISTLLTLRGTSEGFSSAVMGMIMSAFTHYLHRPMGVDGLSFLLWIGLYHANDCD